MCSYNFAWSLLPLQRHQSNIEEQNSKRIIILTKKSTCLKQVDFLVSKNYFFISFLITSINVIGYIILVRRPILNEFSPNAFIEATIPVKNGAKEHPISPKMATALYIAPLPSGIFLEASSTVPGHSVLIANPQREHPASEIIGLFESAAAK